jgi:formate hydrogenlyase subunit 3/multisubunit Na+/H+ antiporter MnhD subunit
MGPDPDNMLELVDKYILLGLVVLPAVGALFVAGFAPARSHRRWAGQLTRFNALMFTMGTLCLAAIAMARLVDGADFTSTSDWLRVAMGLDFAWGMNAISAVGVVTVALIAPAAVMASSRQTATAARGHFAWLLLGESCLLGALLARDLLLLSFFADGAIVVAFLALGRSRRVAGDRSFRWLTTQLLASGAWWVGVLQLGWVHYVKTGLMSFAFADLLYLQLASPQALAIGALLGVATFAKAGVWPLRLGLPYALHAAPAGANVFLVGGVMKLGIYLAVAVVLPATLPHSLDAGLAVSVVLAGVALLSAVSCYRQRTAGDFLAASASLIASLAMLGVATGTAMGMSGAMLLAAAHAVSFAGLMLVLVSALPGATSAHLADLVGLGRRRPGLAVLGSVWLLSMVAVPGLGVFVGASMVLGAKMPAIRAGEPLWIAAGVAAAFATAMHTAQMVMLVLRVLTGSRDAHAARQPLPPRPDSQHAFRAMGMTTVLLAAMLLLALGADLFEPAVAADASRSLATAMQREAFPGDLHGTLLVGPWRRVVAQGVVLLGVAVALLAMRSRRTWHVLVGLWLVQWAGVALTGVTGNRPPSFSYFTSGARVTVASAASLLLHTGGIVLAMTYVVRTRREPTRRLRDLAGMASSHPGSAVAIGVMLWSVAGLAPTLGAMGWVMRGGCAISAGWPGVAAGWAVVRGLSAVACLRLVSAMLRPAPSGELFPAEPMPGGTGQLWRMGITAAVSAIVVLGILPEVLMEPLAIWLP